MSQQTTTTFDPKAFRAALGTFATGVTVITTIGRNSDRIGLTANSFNSVSLDPPLVLWSLAKKAYSLADFQYTKHWAVHVLAANQEHLSHQFSRAGKDKFAGVAVEESPNEVPLLPGCAARFECRAVHQYDGGDHIIFVGEVLNFERNALPPLVFHSGQYALATSKGAALNNVSSEDEEPIAFSSDMLGYLLGRARRHFQDGMRSHLAAKSLTDHGWRVLTMVLAKQQLSAMDIARLSADAEADVSCIVKTLQQLQNNGWLRSSDSVVDARTVCTLTEQGFIDSLNLVAVAKAHEAQLLEQLGGVDGVVLKNLLHKFIQTTDSGQPSLWTPESSHTSA